MLKLDFWLLEVRNLSVFTPTTQFKYKLTLHNCALLDQYKKNFKHFKTKFEQNFIIRLGLPYRF